MLDLFRDESFPKNMEASCQLAMADITESKMLKDIWNSNL
jgi:hypothetical protein